VRKFLHIKTTNLYLFFCYLVINTPPSSRSNHLCVNIKGKHEHPIKQNLVDPSIFTR